MIERDRFAFAALSCVMQSDADCEILGDTAKANDVKVCDQFAEFAYAMGDAMHRVSAQDQATADVVTYPNGTAQIG